MSEPRRCGNCWHFTGVNKDGVCKCKVPVPFWVKALCEDILRVGKAIGVHLPEKLVSSPLGGEYSFSPEELRSITNDSCEAHQFRSEVFHE